MTDWTMLAGATKPDGSYFFPDAVRTECPPHYWEQLCKPAICPCQGRGWVAETDAWIWLKVLWDWGDGGTTLNNAILNFGNHGQDGFIETVAKAVEAADGTLGGVL